MIIGNLTRDPELRTTPNGQNVANFGVATNHYWTDASGQKQEKAEFHNIVAWGKLAEICSQYLGKGRKVYIEGRLQTSEWEGQDGTKRNRTEIVAENMIMLDRAPAGSGNGYQSPQSQQQQASSSNQPATATATPSQNNNSGEEEIRVEDIPF